MTTGRRADADAVVTVLERLVSRRGAPGHLRMDNGPELIAWALRDWCRLSGAGTIYIEPGSPWENPYVESFNGRAREYNTYRPHSALGGLTPSEYAERWTEENLPALS